MLFTIDCMRMWKKDLVIAKLRQPEWKKTENKKFPLLFFLIKYYVTINKNMLTAFTSHLSLLSASILSLIYEMIMWADKFPCGIIFYNLNRKEIFDLFNLSGFFYHVLTDFFGWYVWIITLHSEKKERQLSKIEIKNCRNFLMT